MSTKIVKKIVEEIEESPKPIYSSGRSGNVEEENTGRVLLKCTRCLSVVSFERMIDTKLACQQCGSDNLMCLSNFRMESPEKEKTMRVGDIITGASSGVWKLV